MTSLNWFTKLSWKIGNYFIIEFHICFFSNGGLYWQSYWLRKVVHWLGLLR